MSRLFKNLKMLCVLKIPVRHNPSPNHWAVLRKKKTNSMKALEYFDDFYKNVFGEESWKNIRSALLSKDHKYVAVLNNFSDVEKSSFELEAMGAMNMKNIYSAFKESMKYVKPKQNNEVDEEINDKEDRISDLVAERQSSLPPYSSAVEYSLTSSNRKHADGGLEPVQLQSIETNVVRGSDSSRIISASAGISASQLYEYVPATKIKGMDDFVLESEHLGYYTQAADFSVKVEKEYELNFPDNLAIYTFEESSKAQFPNPEIGSTEVLDYFLLDGASILPVLSLDLQPGDVFLDMCAAPGGKSMIALQTLLPRLIVANDVQESRINRINNFLEEMLADIGDWDKKFFVTQSDARSIEDVGMYNKILVDVPCTTDRHCVHEDDNNIFKHSRIKERLRLPELQSAILKNALKIVKPGGTVVYSTCSMSPIQNDGVVQVALKGAYEEYNSIFVVKDQSAALAPLRYLYNFGGEYGLRYGHLVVPTKARNWGPMYFCKMVRVQ
ncbi:hypothetical protein QAD02_016469 [Eretmocerus hayati]|uniref:Uncharacterized protein n=1 Tax=Eretmocerus hayati TaxID=131215 RepID=A0ACC2PE16_9HYME|nr:hypothetical protein QAD02_016469 [Eretmocerus hayati]